MFDPLVSYRAIMADLFSDPYAPKRESAPSPLPSSKGAIEARDGADRLSTFVTTYGSHAVDIIAGRERPDLLADYEHMIEERPTCWRVYFTSKWKAQEYAKRREDGSTLVR